MTELAARGSGWGGAVVGMVAASIFVLFSGWILAQRLRADRRARGSDNGKGADD